MNWAIPSSEMENEIVSEPACCCLAESCPGDKDAAFCPSTN